MSLKFSKFNFIYNNKNMQKVLYNSFSKAVAVLEEQELMDLTESIEAKSDNKLFFELKENGFLVDQDLDEVGFLKYFHYKEKYAKKHLTLTIAPTLECNFRCPYCYETPKKGNMNSEVQAYLIEYIEAQIKDGVEDLDITWYGGEPLLYPEIIDNLAGEIRYLTQTDNVKLHMNIVTNGYNLSPSVLDMLEKNQINSIQITLDGMKENHDKRRFLTSGRGTFEQIFKNLKLLSNYDIKAVIRMNVDRYNFHDFYQLKELIDGLKNDKLSIYPAMVENINESDPSREEYYMDSEEFSQFLQEASANSLLVEDAMSEIDKRCFYCTAELEQTYVIDPVGNCYKCWDEIGKESEICFNLSDTNKINYNNYVKYLVSDPFADPKCSNCKYLPLCFGGCKFQRFNLQKQNCNFTDQSMKVFINNKYFNEMEV